MLFEEQPLLFDPLISPHERSVSGALAGKFVSIFKDYHVNVEWDKMVDENDILIPKKIGLNPYETDKSKVYPDIIVHRQESALSNLLIIELKMSWKKENWHHDIIKLNNYMSELNYQFGLFLELDRNAKPDMIWFEN